MLQPVTYRRFVAEVRRRAGLSTDEAARRVTAATLDVLASCLAKDEAEAVADSLPEPLDARLRGYHFEAPLEIEELYGRVATRDATDIDRAREQTQVVCELIGEVASDEAAAHLRRLPRPFAMLFEPRPIGRPESEPRGEAGSSLAAGQFGGGRSLADAGPEHLAHHDSISRDGDPERKISTAVPDNTLGRGRTD
jgi:uncharacterized protein (DUF2267 family)